MKSNHNRIFNIKNFSRHKIYLYLIIAVGIIIRLFHFFYNRSLWEDEIYLASGIANHTFKDILTQPLPYLQKAPPGYLFFARLCVAILGENEMGLRLYSLLCGIAALFVFIPVTKYFLKPTGQLVAVVLLAICHPIIYHSVEVKPYITEVLATIIVMYWYTKYRYETNIRGLFAWGLKGAIVVWFCYPSIFVLAATGLTIAIHYIKTKNWKVIALLFVPAIMWLVSFVISYLLYAKPGSDSTWLVYYWTHVMDGYMPRQLVPGAMWFIRRVFTSFDNTLGLSWSADWREHDVIKLIMMRMAYIPFLLFIAGVIYFYRYNKSVLVLVGSVFLLAFTASALVLYPMNERLMMYLTPFLILIFAGGSQFVLQSNLLIRVPVYILTAMVIILAAKNSFAHLINPYTFGDNKKSYQREALLYLNDHYLPGDEVYVYRNDIPGYTLYKKLYNLKYNAVIGKDYRLNSKSFNEYFSKLDKDISIFSNSKRVWVVYGSYIDIPVGETGEESKWYYNNLEGVKRFQSWLASKAVQKEAYKPEHDDAVDDIHVCLMDFTKNK
jgi:hypothetical protein